MAGIFGLLTVVTAASICLLAGQTAPLSQTKQGTAKPDSRQNGPSQANSQNAQSVPQNASADPRQPSTPGRDENCQNQRQNLEIQRKMEWFTGVLAAVGILQGVVLFLTWKTIRRQANLQKFLTRQWVDIGSWSVGGDDAWDREHAVNRTSKTITEVSKKLKSSMSMAVSFEVFNKTTYPLTIARMEVRIGKPKLGEWGWSTFDDREGFILAPHSAGSENSETCTVPFSLDTEDEVFRFTKNCQYLRIYVRVFFLDSEGKTVHQNFAVETLFGEKETRFYKYSSRKVRKVDTPSAQEENQQPQKPN